MTDRVVDYAWSRPPSLDPYVGVMRYISHDGTKDLSPAERDSILSAHKTIGLVFEATANRAAQGVAAGAEDARYANARADALGYPRECTLWFAVDFDGSPAQVQPYFDGVASVAGRPHAPYGSFRVIEGVRYPGAGWQTVAWSGGRVSPRAGLLQDKFANAFDENRVLRPDYGAWGVAAPAPPHQSVSDDQEVDVITIEPADARKKQGLPEEVVVAVPPARGGGAHWGQIWGSLFVDTFGGPANDVRVMIKHQGGDPNTNWGPPKGADGDTVHCLSGRGTAPGQSWEFAEGDEGVSFINRGNHTVSFLLETAPRSA